MTAKMAATTRAVPRFAERIDMGSPLKTVRRIARDEPSATGENPRKIARTQRCVNARSQRAVSAAHGRCAIARAFRSIGAWHLACCGRPHHDSNASRGRGDRCDPGRRCAAGSQLRTRPAHPPHPPHADAPTTDIFDVWRAFRHEGPPVAEPAWDYRKAMKAFAPVIGAKPSAGALFGVAGNIAFYRGDPGDDTHFLGGDEPDVLDQGPDRADRSRHDVHAIAIACELEADHRFQWTSLETPPLGTSADTDDSVLTDFDFFRLHHTAYYQLRARPLCRRRYLLRHAHQHRAARGR